MSALVRSLAVPALALLANAAPALAQSNQRYTLQGDDVAVWNLAGTVRVVAGSGSDVTVELARGGRDGARLRVEQGPVDRRESLRVIFPDRRVVYPALRGEVDARVRANGTFGNDGGFFGSDRVQIRRDGGGAEAWADLTVAVPRGRKVAVHLLAGTAEARNVDGELTLDVHAADVTTDGTRGRLLVDAGSGRVRVHDAQGELDLDTGSGSVELQQVKVDRLRIDAGSGALRGGDVTARDVDMDLGSGGARLARVDARNLKLDSGSGAVEIEFTADVDDVRIDSGSGSVTLRIPPSLGAALDIDTGSGGISADLPITVTRQERDRLVGAIGDGRGRIVIDAGSGRVRLLKS